MADGSLKFDTKIDTDGVEKGTITIKELFQRLIKSVDTLSASINNAFTGLNAAPVTAAVEQTEAAVNEVDNAIKEADDSARRMAISMQAVDAAIERMNAEQTPDIIPDAEVAAASELAEVIDQVSAELNDVAVASDKTEASIDTALNSGTDNANEFNNMMDLIKRTISDIPIIFDVIRSKVSGAFSGLGKTSNDATETKNRIQTVVEEVDTLRDRLASLEKQGLYFGDKEYDEAYQKLTRLEKELGDYKKSLTQVDTAQKKVSRSADTVSKSVNKEGSSMGQGRMSMLKMLKMSLVFSVAFQTLSGAVNGIVTGFQNLAQVDATTNRSLSALMTALLQLKNSLATAFSPILTAITPVLQTMINYLSAAITKVGEFFAALLLGKTTFTKAVTAQTDYAASVKKSTDATEKEKGSLAGFDKLNNQTDSKAGSKDATPGIPDPVEMFKTENIDTKISDLADRVKIALSNLFEPIKTSWDTYGKNTIDSVKTAFDNVLSAVGLVGESLKIVWTNGTGAEVISNVLLIFTNINDTISAIATNFKNAWASDNTGTAIIQNIADIINNLLIAIKGISVSTKEWASGLDFSPILTAFENLTSSLEPFSKTIGDGLKWFYDNILLPLAKWTITDALPAFFNLLSGAIDVINAVLEALKPLGQWLWDNFLQPIAAWTGGVITDVLNGITDGLKKVSDWISTNQSLVQGMAITLGVFATAWTVTGIAEFIVNAGGVVGVLNTLTTALWACTGAKIADKAETLAIVALYAKDFVVSIASGIVALVKQEIAYWSLIAAKIADKAETVAIIALYAKDFVVSLVTGTAALIKQAAQWVINTALKVADTAATVAMTVATTAWNAICTVATVVTTAFGAAVAFLTSPIGLVILAITAIIAAIVLLVKNWDTVKAVALKCWDGIKNTWDNVATWFNNNVITPMGNFFSGLWKGITSGVNALKAIFKTVFDALVDIVKTPINLIIDIINGMVGGIVSGINTVLKAVNSISFELPKALGGFKVGFDFPLLTAPKIPRLATGTVVPANYGEFLSILGDNKREAEVVSPVSTMKQAFKEAMAEMGGSGSGELTVNVYLSGKQIHTEVVKQDKEYKSQTGKSAFAY
jgi:hypothetical protein